VTLSKCRDRLSDESGFTLIELLVSAVILVIGVFGLVTSVNTSHKLSDVSEHETVASQIADRELNLALAIPYPFVALSTSLPTSGAATDDGTRWNSWLTSGVLPHPSSSFSCSSASVSNRNPALPNDEQSTGCIVACPTAGASPGCPGIGKLAPISTVSVPTASGSARVLKIYRYVSWVNDLSCGSSCPNPVNAGYKGDYKRVTIAVLPVVGGTATSGAASQQALTGPKQPVVVSAIRNDPTLGAHNASSNDPSPCGVGGIEC
jgi:prepilin-type N-terminal cleavage/methylation domain-containing protein